MPKKRYRPEEIISKLREADVLFLNAAHIFPIYLRSLNHLEEILADHREEVVLAIPEIGEHILAVIQARQEMMQ